MVTNASRGMDGTASRRLVAVWLLGSAFVSPEVSSFESLGGGLREPAALSAAAGATTFVPPRTWLSARPLAARCRIATMQTNGGEETQGEVIARPRGRPRQGRPLEDLQIGDRLKGVVASELEGTTGKKAWITVPVVRIAKGGKYARVDAMIRLDKEKGVKKKKVAVDKPVTVYVKKVMTAEGRLEVSLRPPKVQQDVVDTSTLCPLTDLTFGDELQGVVKSVTQFAAFVSCGVGRPTRRLRSDGKPMVLQEIDGFLGKEDLPPDTALSGQLVKTEDTKVVIREGDFIKVFVKEVFPGNGRFRLTMDANLDPKSVKTMTNKVQKEKSRFARRKNVEDLVVGEEMLGAIVKAYEYGFFVDVGAKSAGLVHISSISEKEDRYLGDLNDFSKVGDKMYVKVDGLDEKGRLALSYVARAQDRPTPINRRQRRRAERGEVEEAEGDIGDDDGHEGNDDGFSFDDFSSGRGDRKGEKKDEGDLEGYSSNLDYDLFDEM